MTLITYPLDDCDYSADDAALFHCTRTSGIFASDDFSFSVSGADNTVSVSPGIAWMRINKFKGLVAALKNEVSVDLGLTDSVYPRIDRVVLQYNANTRDTTVVVKRGVPRSNPLPPERSTEEALYELHLLEVLRKPAAASVKQEDVTDLRFDSSCCGIMADSVTKVDTSAINAQIMELIKKLREEINAVTDGSAFLLRDGSTPMEGEIAMGGNKITDLGNPEDDADAATKGYADLAAYPVGAIYISANNTSPASLFGGTWTQLKDRFLLGAGDTYSAGSTGGEAAHKLTIDEMPAHYHNFSMKSGASTGTYQPYPPYSDNTGTVKTYQTQSTGGGQAHNNMPPYLAVYMWKRVA